MRMPYLDILGMFLEDVGGVGNRAILAESLLETRDDAVHLADLVLQVQRRICPAEKNTEEMTGAPPIL